MPSVVPVCVDLVAEMGARNFQGRGSPNGVLGDSLGAITEAGQQVKVVGFPVEAEGRQADRATATTMVRRGRQVHLRRGAGGPPPVVDLARAANLPERQILLAWISLP